MIHLPNAVRYDKVVSVAELNVIDACHLSAPNGWEQKERFLDTFELIYVTAGSLVLFSHNKTIELKAGDAYIVRQYTTLTGGCSKEALSFYSVSFTSTIEAYQELYETPLHVTVRSSYLETLFNNLTFHTTSHKTSGYLLDASFLLILDTLSSLRKKEPERVQMQGILTYIHQNINTPLTAEQISEHFHYNSDYLAKLFKEQFQMTIKQYIVEKKLSVAKRLLTMSTLSVKAVGEAIGFEDAILFEKFFKYHTKLSPKKYRLLYR